MAVKSEDVAFWVLILAAVAIILWLLKGSPGLENAIITIGLFIISSELILWRKHFSIDKNTAVSFARLKNDILNLSNSQKEINKKLDNITYTLITIPSQAR